MAGQSERIFRDTLCESRSYGVETTDPTSARVIDELKRTVKDLRAVVEAEKVKQRQLEWEHNKQLQHIREEEARRLDASLEACVVRKEQEKANEMKKLEERLKKQKNQEFRLLEKEKADELNRCYKKWHLDKSEAVRVAVDTEKRQSLEELQASFAEEEALARENKLTREVFVLGEQNNALEQQVKNLSRLSRAQIDQMRRIKQECDAKVESVIRQHKIEASREMAQIKLAEQIIAEKDHDLHAIEYRADMAMMEKEALEEEIATMRSVQNINNSSFHDTSQHESTPSRRSMGGSVLQKRVDELETRVKKLEDEKANLKQDNASLRKKLLQDDGEKRGGGKGGEDMVKALRKKNSELMVATKELEDKIKALKAENDQLQKDKGPPGESEQNVRKILARQHAKDISEYTKQIHGKDRELTNLRNKVAKLDAAALTHSEPAPELEKKVKSMAMDKLRMERLVVKLYSRLPDVVSMKDLDPGVESSKVEQLTTENQTLRSRVQMLEGATSPEGMEGGSTRESLVQEKEELLVEVDRLRRLSQSASKLESECISLRQSHDNLESTNASLEQRCHELSQQLKLSILAVKELEGSQELSTDLEREVQQLKGQVREKDHKVAALETECKEASAQLSGKQAIIAALQEQMESLEDRLKEKEQLNARLQFTLENALTKEKPFVQTTDTGTQSHDRPQAMDMLNQTHPEAIQKPILVAAKVRPDSGSKRFGKERIKSPVRRGLRSHSPRTSSGDLLDSSLDNEMRAAGIDVNDSFDSSEGVGFSDTNLDMSIPGSDQSVTKEEGGDFSMITSNDPQRRLHASLPHRTAWGEKAHTDQAQAITSADQPKGPDAEGVVAGSRAGGEGGSEVADGQGLLSHLVDRIRNGENVVGAGGGGEESGQLSVGSEGEVSQDKDSDDSPTPQSDNYKVGVYIAKFSYTPSEMSPNPNYDLELPLMAGDYLYVYGDMDEDGFYHAQLMSGQSGMVPSNFIEKVTDDEEDEASCKPHKSPGSHLQDIEEVDEEVSSGGVGSIPSPRELMLERQYVDGGQYSVAIQWELPRPLPDEATGYCAYVNGEFNHEVSGAEQTSVLLTGIPRKQLVKISVRTTTEEGESPDPAKLIILNPQYPEAPTNVTVVLSTNPLCLVVQWTPSKPLKEGNPLSGYVVYLNNHSCVSLGTNPRPVKSVCAQIFATDLKDYKSELMRAGVVSLTVCAVSGEYLSTHSLPVVVSKEDLLSICDAGKMTADESEITSSATSLSSVEVEEEREVYSNRAVGEEEGPHSQGVGVVTAEGIGIANGVAGSPPPQLPPANGTAHVQDEHTGPMKYYRAMVHYDPQLQSPNEDTVDEELAFLEHDIIIGLEPVDEDGFIMAELNGRTGYIPSNLVEEVTDQEELSRIDILIRDQATQAGSKQCNMNGNQMQGFVEEEDGPGPHKMKVMFDYDPVQDSPNANSDLELAVNEGAVVTVFGKPDMDGFFQAELAGKKGLLPSNFLKEITPPINDGIEIFAADEDSMKIADRLLQKVDMQSKPQTWNSEKSSNHSQKRKGGILSRGKNLLTKGKGKGKHGE